MTYKGGGDGLQSNGRGDESGFDALLWCGEARGQRGDSNRRRVVQQQDTQTGARLATARCRIIKVQQCSKAQARPVSASRLQLLGDAQERLSPWLYGATQTPGRGRGMGHGRESEGGGVRVMGRRIGGGQADWTPENRAKVVKVGIWACLPLRAPADRRQLGPS